MLLDRKGRTGFFVQSIDEACWSRKRLVAKPESVAGTLQGGLLSVLSRQLFQNLLKSVHDLSVLKLAKRCYGDSFLNFQTENAAFA